jgi:hypothetical protein
LTLINKVPRDKLEKGMWYAQIIQLELNHIYRIWYGEEPRLTLRRQLNSFLLEHHRDYYNRIIDFHRGFFNARHSIIIEP